MRDVAGKVGMEDWYKYCFSREGGWDGWAGYWQAVSRWLASKWVVWVWQTDNGYIIIPLKIILLDANLLLIY